MTARETAERISAGTMIILRGIAWAGEWRETLARWVLLALGSAIAASAVTLHPWLIAPAILGWYAAAMAATRPDDEDQDDEAEPDDDPDEPPLDADSFAELVNDVAQGSNVHLSAIRARLAQELPAYDWTAPAVTALCEAAGIPVRKGVRVPGATPPVTTGIHRTDLPPLPSPTSWHAPVDVVATGQRSNNNTNTFSIEQIGEGSATIVTHGPSTRQEAKGWW